MPHKWQQLDALMAAVQQQQVPLLVLFPGPGEAKDERRGEERRGGRCRGGSVGGGGCGGDGEGYTGAGVCVAKSCCRRCMWGLKQQVLLGGVEGEAARKLLYGLWGGGRRELDVRVTARCSGGCLLGRKGSKRAVRQTPSKLKHMVGNV